MKKSTTKQGDHRKLIDRLLPEPSFKRLMGILATTYEMQPEFVETDFLPSLLGLGAWDDRNWTSRISLEKNLAELDLASIMVDARPYRGRPRSLQLELRPVLPEQGRLLHAKVLLIVYEEAIRLIVGSANLTEPGYRKNREIIAVLTASAKRPDDVRLISDAIEGLYAQLKDWMSPSATQFCEQALKRLAAWKSDSDSKQWFSWGGHKNPVYRQMIEQWPPHEKIHRMTIVSPFWSEETSDGPISRFVSALRSADILSIGAELSLYTEGATEAESIYRPQLPPSFATFDARVLGIQASASAVDPRVPPEEVELGEGFTGARSLHAKVVLLEGDTTSLAYLGSANFTNRGWGFTHDPQRANIEAGVILRRNGRDRTALKALLPPTTGKPIALEGAASGWLAVPDSSPDELPWPEFIRDVLLEPSEVDGSVLELVVVTDPTVVAGVWRIGVVGVELELTKVLLTGDKDSKHPARHQIQLDDETLRHLLREREVHVSWWQCEDGRRIPLNVSPQARLSLPISPESGQPEEQNLIAYYQGQISWEDLFPEPNEPRKDGHDTSESGNKFTVDTSQIQSYVVREFVEALTGINKDLRAAAKASRAGMRLALLGSVSPTSLARRIMEAGRTGTRSPTASGFQLVEILGALSAARKYETAEAFRDDWLRNLNEATDAIQKMLDELTELHSSVLSSAFQRYAKTIREHHMANQHD